MYNSSVLNLLVHETSRLLKVNKEAHFIRQYGFKQYYNLFTTYCCAYCAGF